MRQLESLLVWTSSSRLAPPVPNPVLSLTCGSLSAEPVLANWVTVVNIPIYSFFSSFIIYSLNYFPDIFLIYLFKAYYLEVTDIFLHFSIKNALYLLGTCSEHVANMFRHIRKFPL